MGWGIEGAGLGRGEGRCGGRKLRMCQRPGIWCTPVQTSLGQSLRNLIEGVHHIANAWINWNGGYFFLLSPLPFTWDLLLISPRSSFGFQGSSRFEHFLVFSPIGSTFPIPPTLAKWPLMRSFKFKVQNFFFGGGG